MEYDALLSNQGSYKNIEAYFDEYHPEIEYEIDPPVIYLEGTKEDILFFANHTKDHAILYEDEELTTPLLDSQENPWTDANYLD